MPTLEELQAVQSECLADDLAIEDRMLQWNLDDARAYFESGGAVAPKHAADDAEQQQVAEELHDGAAS